MIESRPMCGCLGLPRFVRVGQSFRCDGCDGYMPGKAMAGDFARYIFEPGDATRYDVFYGRTSGGREYVICLQGTCQGSSGGGLMYSFPADHLLKHYRMDEKMPNDGSRCRPHNIDAMLAFLRIMGHRVEQRSDSPFDGEGLYRSRTDYTLERVL